MKVANLESENSENLQCFIKVNKHDSLLWELRTQNHAVRKEDAGKWFAMNILWP